MSNPTGRDIYEHYHAALFRQPTAAEAENVTDAITAAYPADLLIVKGAELVAYLYHAVQCDGPRSGWAIWVVGRRCMCTGRLSHERILDRSRG